MEFIIALVFLLLLITSVSSVYLLYQLRRAQEHIRDAIKICEDAVNSLRAGKG